MLFFLFQKSDLHRSIDHKLVKSRNLGNIFRKIMTKEVAEQFAPVLDCKGKRSFEKTKLFACLKGIFCI